MNIAFVHAENKVQPQGGTEMPLIVKKIGTLSFLVFLLMLSSFAQPDAQMRQQLSRARVLLATKNYNSAILELNAIRKESTDDYVQNVALSMLMNVYVEQSDYKKAQELLTEIYNSQKLSKKNSATYNSAAAQIVRGSKLQVERYKSLGLNVLDAKLPKEADADLDKMRGLLELVVKQTEDLGASIKQTEDSMALIEESSAARSNIARDEYDASRWKTKVIDAREKMATSRSSVVSVVDESMQSVAFVSSEKNIANNNTVAVERPKIVETIAKIEPETPKIELKPLETKTIFVPKPTEEPTVLKEVAKKEVAKVEEVAVSQPTEPKIEKVSNPMNDSNSDNPVQIGSLREYAVTLIQPQYPLIAKSMRLSGVVQIDVIVDETGKVSTIQNSSGPDVLKRAATDALKKWKFKPFLKDGLPVKAIGFVKFNFAL